MPIRAGNRKTACVLFVVVLAALSLSAQSVPARDIDDQKPGQRTGHTESFEELAQRAQAALVADKVPEAIRLYERATAIQPNWAEGWWHLGTLFFDTGRFREARDAFGNFLTIEKKEPGPGFAMLGLCEFQLKDYPKSRAALERGIKLGLGTNSVFARSVLYEDGILNTLLGQPEVALQRFTLIANQIAAAHPESPKDSVLGDSELLDAFGIAALRIPKLPADIPATKAALVRSAGRAQAFIALQDRVSADAELKQLVAQYPSESGVHYFYGVFSLKEHPPLALDEFRREIEVTPSHTAARINLAFELLNAADYDQGLKYATEAIALEPNNFVAHVVCGRLWLALNNTSRAVQELRIAVKLAPGSPDAHFALSRALTQAGQASEAARERAQFQRLKGLADAASR